MQILDDISTGKIKRVFRAKQKLNVPGLVSHITQRAAGKEPLFLEDTDYLHMLGVLKAACQQHRVKVYAFCLMENHIHLLIRPEAENLHHTMRDLYSRYAMWFNRKYERKGHLFGGPYRQAVCLDDGYLLTASVYIHLNPVRAGVVSSAQEYQWSSVGLYCKEGPKSFVDPYFILNMLSDNIEKANEIYRDFLNQSIHIKTPHVFEQEGVIDRFRASLVSLFPNVFKGLSKENRTMEATGLKLLSMETIEEKIESLRTQPFTPAPNTRLAKKYLIEQLISRGYKRTEIADQLGLSRKTVYNILHTPPPHVVSAGDRRRGRSPKGNPSS